MNDCSFINDDATVIENKAIRPSFTIKEKLSPLKANEPLRLVYTGTIAESYGIFDCVSLAEQLRQRYPALELRITGYCPRQDTLEKLHQCLENKPYIHFIGGQEPVPHPRILQELDKADYALIAYRLNPSNQDCFPTRIWECLAHKVPMLMRQEHPWCYLLDEYAAGLAVDFDNPGNVALTGRKFYHKRDIPDSFYWDWEAKKLVETINSLF